MSLLKDFDWSAKSIAKILGVGLLGLVVFSVVVALISFSFRTIMSPSHSRGGYGGGYATSEMAMDQAMSSKMMVPPMPGGGFSTGDDAEEYEVKEYNGTIRTRYLEKVCDVLSGLKEKTYIIFENANKSDTNCNYTFKVARDKADEVLVLLEKLNPEHLNANIHSIKASVDHYESEIEILEKKLTSIEEALANAQQAYDEVNELATKQQDVEVMADIIEKKLNLIDRLSNARLELKEKRARFERSKADQLDRLQYVFFRINVYQDLLVDIKQIKQSWHQEAKQLVNNFNRTIQDLSLGLVSYVIRFAQVVIYLLLSVFLLKFVWIAAKKIWKR